LGSAEYTQGAKHHNPTKTTIRRKVGFSKSSNQMIKNPKIGQSVWLIETDFSTRKTLVTGKSSTNPELIICEKFDAFYPEELFLTEKSAIQRALKILNKQILDLSKKREKLASRLAEIVS
jgi:hypothetical protein